MAVVAAAGPAAAVAPAAAAVAVAVVAVAAAVVAAVAAIAAAIFAVWWRQRCCNFHCFLVMFVQPELWDWDGFCLFDFFVSKFTHISKFGMMIRFELNLMDTIAI